jgi:hypothetical protein
MPKANTETFRTTNGVSKVEAARKIFSNTVGMSRQLVVQRMQRELNLTDAGASTYYQNCRKAAGLVGQGRGASA